MNTQSPIACDADPEAISIAEARKRISESLSPLSSTQSIACSIALSRITAKAVLSPISVPSFRASAMDGYAVKVQDCHSDLLIAGHSLAGHPGIDKMPDGTCQRITTGARVPDEADAVVQQENVARKDDLISVLKQPAIGLNIRVPGSDSMAGTSLLPTGCVLGAAELALLAAHAINQVEVRSPLKIALFSTGDELVDSTSTRGTGQIYDANRPLLKALLNDPSIDIIDLGIVQDSPEEINNILQKALSADLILSSGGVSVGDADHMRSVIEQIGRINLWKIAMKPGRPLTFGKLTGDTPYFGLPGNPVSAAITCLLFVKPAIQHLLGLPRQAAPALYLPLTDKLNKNPGRVEFQRGQMICEENDQWMVSTTGMQDSHVLTSLHKANCLIELPLESTGANVGDLVKVIPFSNFAGNTL